MVRKRWEAELQAAMVLRALNGGEDEPGAPQPAPVREERVSGMEMLGLLGMSLD
jgi:hypothetical protein